MFFSGLSQFCVEMALKLHLRHSELALRRDGTQKKNSIYK